MTAVKFAYNTLVYVDEDIEMGIKRIAGCGYDAAEFVGEPEQMDAGRIRGLLDMYALKASSICGIYTPERFGFKQPRNSQAGSTVLEAVRGFRGCVRRKGYLGNSYR